MNDSIAVITDIHGNIYALQAVLDDIDKQKSVSHIYCLGDMIGIGPFTNEVLDCLISRPDVTVLSGNHEESVIALIKGEPYPKRNEKVKPHHQWIADRLDPSFVTWLSELPRKVTTVWGEKHLLFQHYHMRPEKESLPIVLNPYEPVDYHPTLTKIESYYQDKANRKDLVCFGHHHPVHLFESTDCIYLNPGSLGCYHKAFARYGIVHNHENNLYATLKEVPYDKSKLLSVYEKWKVPARDFILKTFHSDIRF
ncbi:metallophosphoesterase family protein [Alteribacillus bidgolensis]|uniref:Calcineurin-like phosphoesterase superfamily domain-containing protein n=1 Tax=Alteribacillus bidgolensis TaxID=930129 RepID=A0A1G8R319_9BACI|nr:metallophosphoesterase family protein [Alteribacillus bidgolensis]SDJ10955.1 Calcineurin-like phosphoesterase superfamily domain-containing protein [Alteribacillus bidgolensis]